MMADEEKKTTLSDDEEWEDWDDDWGDDWDDDWDESDEESGAGAFAPAVKLFSLGRKVMLAGLGVIAITAEEAGSVLNTLIERGELAGEDAAKLVNLSPEGGDELEQGDLSGDKSPETRLEESVEAILARLNVPTKRDIEELTRKVDELNRKIAELG